MRIKLLLLFLPLLLQAETFCYFNPPKEWNLIDPSTLSSRVKMGFIGKGEQGFQPSLNLAVEEVSISLPEYVKAVKAIHEADRTNRWRDLGKITTCAGEARLTEIDTTTEWGPTRLLQLLFVQESKAYILTACALKNDFSGLYRTFQNVFHSFTLTTNLLNNIPSAKKKELLQQEIASLPPKASEKQWLALQKKIIDDYAEMGACWQLLLLQELKGIQ